MKWELLEVELERKKSKHGSVMEKGKPISLGIFGLVMFPSLTGVISLKDVVVFGEYEYAQINYVVAILAETILTLNHCR